MLDLVFVLAIAAIVTALAVPHGRAGIDRARGLAAARYLAARMALARAQAVSQGATVALQFDDGEGDMRFATFVDGNGNGVRARDIEAGVDWPLDPAVQLSDLFPGVVIGLAADTPGTDAVQLGRSTILSFTPSGTATSGTIHVLGRDGTQWAVRVLGATARTRVLRYVSDSADWVEAF